MSDFVSLLLIAAFLFVLPYACFRAAAARNRSRRWWRVPIIGVVATTLLYLVTILTQPVLDWRRDVAAFWAEGGPPPMLGTPGVIDPDAADGRGAAIYTLPSGKVIAIEAPRFNWLRNGWLHTFQFFLFASTVAAVFSGIGLLVARRRLI